MHAEKPPYSLADSTRSNLPCVPPLCPLSPSHRSVSFFGEAEFWLALGKVLLVFAMTFYTLITMLGGNPLGDRYGFR